jgi:hypothetical protein
MLAQSKVTFIFSALFAGIYVSFSYGSRFVLNMRSSILGGVHEKHPAVLLTAIIIK